LRIRAGLGSPQKLRVIYSEKLFFSFFFWTNREEYFADCRHKDLIKSTVLGSCDLKRLTNWRWLEYLLLTLGLQWQGLSIDRGRAEGIWHGGVRCYF